MPSTPNELELDHMFWSALESDGACREWLLKRTKFSVPDLELVTDEKWHQRWYRDPESSKDSETDILLMWRDVQSGERVALHIENKPAHRKWEPLQASNYRRRAENRKQAWRYVDFEVVLLAPSAFIARHFDEAAQFDFVITYEEISQFVPAFGAAIPAGVPDIDPKDKLRVELLRWRLEPHALAEQPWLAQVREGRFEMIPGDFGWEESAGLAHMINGYELFDLQALANERLDSARETGRWTGNPLELWACLYGEHRRVRHSGYPLSEEEVPLYDMLCRTLRDKLQGQA